LKAHINDGASRAVAYLSKNARVIAIDGVSGSPDGKGRLFTASTKLIGDCLANGEAMDDILIALPKELIRRYYGLPCVHCGNDERAVLPIKGCPSMVKFKLDENLSASLKTDISRGPGSRLNKSTEDGIMKKKNRSDYYRCVGGKSGGPFWKVGTLRLSDTSRFPKEMVLELIERVFTEIPPIFLRNRKAPFSSLFVLIRAL